MMDPSAVFDIVIDLLVRYSFQVIAAMAILVGGVIVARIAGGFVERSLTKTTLERHLQTLLVRAAKIVILLFTTILALDKFGVQVTALVAGISVAGVAGGFALQGVLGNVAAGLSIMFSHLFRIGDYIEIGSVRGQVEAINLTSILLRTLEDARVIVPNRRIVGEIVYNYSGERRVPMTVEVGYQEDMDRALQTMQEVLAANPRVLKVPSPEIGIAALGDSGVRFALRPWCRAEDFWRVQYEVYRAILDRFRERAIGIPYPIREIRMVSPEP
ncbi:MAG: mechanosensitive ion channel family protein [candidate division NC10 bacterium]|nr:mechanosensitive ion channel family protein [candidate division NC10 bacterium]